MLHRISTQIGVTETDHGAVSEAVCGYYRVSGREPPSALPCPYWGGLLLAWAALSDGLTPPDKPDNPLSWIVWGDALAEPVPNAVVIMTEGSGRHQLQIGVVARVAGRKASVACVHDGTVQVIGVPIERIVAARRIPLSGQIIPPPLPLAVVPAPQQHALPPPERPEGPQTVTPADIDMDRLLQAIQQKFADHEQQLDQIRRHAIGAITVKDGTNG